MRLFGTLMIGGLMMSASVVFGQAVEDLMIEKLGPSINSNEYDESAPVLSFDGKLMFFTRTAHPEFNKTLILNEQDLSKTLSPSEYKAQLGSIYSQITNQNIQDPYTSDYNQDIWVANQSSDGQFSVFHPEYPMNNALPNSVLSTEKDSQTFIVLNQFFEDGSMYAGFSKVRYDQSTSSFPEPIHIYGFDLQSDDVNLAMSADGDVIVLSMERKGGLGLHDLYVCFYMRPGVYSKPQHMGSVLNSEAQETTPFISRDKRKIYFSSNRPGTIGGNDLYVSNREDWTWKRWSTPKSLGQPFNSSADDAQPFVDENANYMYFSSKRDGSSDIFRVSLTPIPKLEQPVEIHGKIVNAETGELMPAELFWGPGSAKGYLEFFRTNTGLFKVTLTENEYYKFMPRKSNFRATRINFDPIAASKNGQFIHELVLYLRPKDDQDTSIVLTGYERTTDLEDREYKKPMPDKDAPVVDQIAQETLVRLQDQELVVGKKISFYNIFFLKSKPVILQKSEPALQELLKIMKDRPTMEIQVEGHTDNVGDAEKNVILSKQRAESIKAYLVEKGIEASRIQTEGFGPYQPITNNATESLREKNRRVEVKILRE